MYYDGNWVEVNQYFKSSETVVTRCAAGQNQVFNTLRGIHDKLLLSQF